MKVSITVWAAIRRNTDDKHEFIDLSSVSSLCEGAVEITSKAGKDLPNWTHDNPVRRIVQVTITEA